MFRHRRRASRALLLAALASVSVAATVAVGCSSSSSPDAVPISAETGADTATAVDGSTPIEDAADAAVDAGPVDRIGAIFAISDSITVDGGAQASYRVGASFQHITTPDGTTTSKTVGPCLLETIGDGAQEVSEDISAGAVHVSGGAKTIDLAPANNATYAAMSGSTSLWTGGEMLVAKGDGKDVPAFMTSLVAPPKVTLSAPATVAGGMTVTRSAGVNATFAAATSGTIVLYFDIATTSQAFAVTCTFDAKTGTAKIPAAAFADFPAGTGTFNFYTKEASIVSPAGWQVHFTASKAIVDPSGASLTGDAVFQ